MKKKVKFSLQILSLLLVLFCTPKIANAQFSLNLEGNFSSVREHIPLENKQPLGGYGLGFSLQYYPFSKWKKLSIINEIKFVEKGYRQKFPNQKYTFKFRYFSVPLLLNYPISKKVAMQSGVELGKLVDTNVKQGTKTYNRFDLGVLAGMSFFDKKRVSVYSRISYGLRPMLDYDKMDALGNFTEKIHDLQNISFTIGLKINLNNEKIKLYK